MWTNADTIVACILAAYVMICALMILPAFARRR